MRDCQVKPIPRGRSTGEVSWPPARRNDSEVQDGTRGPLLNHWGSKVMGKEGPASRSSSWFVETTRPCVIG